DLRGEVGQAREKVAGPAGAHSGLGEAAEIGSYETKIVANHAAKKCAGPAAAKAVDAGGRSGGRNPTGPSYCAPDRSIREGGHRPPLSAAEPRHPSARSPFLRGPQLGLIIGRFAWPFPVRNDFALMTLVRP